MKQDTHRHRAQIEAYVSEEERRELHATSWIRTLFTFGHIWLALAVSFLLVYVLQRAPLYAQVLSAPPLVFFIGTRINALAVEVHEASHGLLFKTKRLNDFFCDVFGSYWILNDTQSYWEVHRVHHSDLHEDSDPDLELYLLPEGSVRGVLLCLLRDVSWITAGMRIRAYLTKGRNTGRTKRLRSMRHMAGKLCAQLIVLGLFLAVFGTPPGIVLYFVYWVIPLFSVFPLLIRLRIATEHYSDLLHHDCPALFVSRTSLSNWVEAYLIGAHMEYHMEHHLYPNIPYFQLKRLHRLLDERGFFAGYDGDTAHLLSGGYVAFWRRLLFRRGGAV